MAESRKKVYIITGLPGAGKTHYRENDEELKDLPYVDIADIYKMYPYGGTDYIATKFVNEIYNQLQVHDEMVVECFGTNRQLGYLHDSFDEVADIFVVHISTSKTVCLERVREALDREPDSPYQLARLNILESVYD